jgi:hypothetical protein
MPGRRWILRIITPLRTGCASLPVFVRLRVTAVENYRVEVLERDGATGWVTYKAAGIEWAEDERGRVDTVGVI